ncbi:MAG TPA: ATP-binding protein [Aggregatilineaceae bacterium]|nr:ATP-binding protein [Aggregatilineaceae bacterium]
MSTSDNVSAVRTELAEEHCNALWLGESCPLLEAVWTLFDVYHVRRPRALLEALQRGIASCVVIDMTSVGDATDLLRDIRRQWPNVGVLALVDSPPQVPITTVPDAQVDHYLSCDADPAEVAAAVRYLAAQTARYPMWDDYERLEERARHLEGLVQAAFAITGVLDADTILGDLREVGRVAVDADEMAVLLAEDDYSDLADALNLGVPGEYLAICRAYLQSLPPEERQRYLGDEVLLRERLPGMLPSAIRIREAEAAGAWSYMRLPLTIDNQLAGFVALFSPTPGQFNGAHLQLGRLFATQVATAVRNMRLYLRLNGLEQRQNAVYRVARLVAEDLALDDVLTRSMEETVRLVQGDHGIVMLVQPDRTLVISAVYNFPAVSVGTVVPTGVGQAGMVAVTGRPSMVADYRHWRQANDALRDLVPENTLVFGVPLTYRGLVLGVLQVLRHKDTPGSVQDVQDVLLMLAPQLAIAVAKAQLHEIVRRDQRRLRAILGHTPAAVVVCDAQGHIQLANPEAERVFKHVGLSFNALQGRRVGDVVRDLLPDLSPSLTEIRNVVEVSLGKAGEYQLHVAPITRPDGTLDGYVGVAQDVTEIRRMGRMKSNLNRVLTHDLGNLLMLARNPIELLDQPDLSQEQRDTLKNMLIASMKRMEALVKDVMDLEMADTLDQGTMVPYRLPPLVQQVVKRNQEEADRQQITLVSQDIQEIERELQGHAILVVQAVDNLVSNAVKYTPPGGRVEISLAVEGEYAVVRVKDTGYGIPADRLQDIFEPFVRIKDQRTVHIQGTGLGLSLVKAFVEIHGGFVTVKSELNVGSEFAIFLPLKPIPQAKSAVEYVTHLDLSQLVEQRAPGP